MPRPRPQDVLFAILGLALVILLAFDIRVAVLALVGAFACGSIYVFAGMLPDRTEGFWNRMFISGFLSIVMSSLVLILPGTFGLKGPHQDVQKAVVVIAGLLPMLAVTFEIVRTPWVIRGILRCFGYR
jgi:ABC-type iron transport system FetAB permease component